MRTPSPDEVRRERERAGWDLTAAASAVGVTERAWRNWEAGARKMPPGLWQLFVLLTGRVTVAFDTPAGRAVVRRTIEQRGT